VGSLTSMFRAGWMKIRTRQCSGAASVAVTTLALTTEYSKLVRLRSSPHAMAGLPVGAGAVQSRSGTTCADTAAAQNRGTSSLKVDMFRVYRKPRFGDKSSHACDRQNLRRVSRDFPTPRRQGMDHG